MSSIWAKGCMLIVRELSDLNDYSSLVEGESHGILYYYKSILKSQYICLVLLKS